MVNDGLRESAKRAIAEWVRSLPSGLAVIEEKEDPAEHVVVIIPRNPRAAQVEIRLSEYGTFGLYVGSGIRIEDLPLSDDYLREICEAVSRGKVEEEAWTRKGKLLKAITVLHLPSGDLHGTEYRSVFGTFGADRHEMNSYEPYS